MWFDLVLRSFQAGFAYPLATETTYYAMLAFGTQPLVLVFAGGLLGAVLASAVNLLLGHLVARGNLQKDKPGFIRLQRILSRYGVWLLAIPGMGLLGMLTLLFAAVDVPMRRIVLALSVEHVLRYAITAYCTKNPELLIALIRALMR